MQKSFIIRVVLPIGFFGSVVAMLMLGETLGAIQARSVSEKKNAQTIEQPLPPIHP